MPGRVKFPPIAILARPVRHQVAATGALERSLKAAGYRVRVDYAHRAPEPVVMAWSWGTAETVRQHNPSAIILTMDHGYTRDRANYINTGWSVPSMYMGLNGWGEHAWVEDGGARATEHGLINEVKPPRKGGNRALLLGQVYGDAMVRGVMSDYKGWLRGQADRLGVDGYKVTFRPHPVMVRRGLSLDYGNLGRLSPHGDLWEDLAETDLAVALNSNGLVAAFLEGIPVQFHNEGTMLSPLADLTDEERWNKRGAWLARLAWAQWRLEELDNGTWLRYHAPIMHRLVEGGPAYPWNERRIDG